jgi:hypothetical protein
MRIRKVGDNDIVTLGWEEMVDSGTGGDDVSVGQLDTF